MLKQKVIMIKVMLPIKKLRKNLKSTLGVQNLPRKISLPINIVKKENLGCKTPYLFLIRNKNPKRKNIIINLRMDETFFLQIPLTDAIKVASLFKVYEGYCF